MRGRISLVGVSGDLIVDHHTVYQTLGQQAGVLLAQLQRAQAAQVPALKSDSQQLRRISGRGAVNSSGVCVCTPGKISLACSLVFV